jgi:tetratricopeptide (TPR) repeat protein
MAKLKLTTLILASTLLSITPVYAAGSSFGGSSGNAAGGDTIATSNYDPVKDYKAGIEFLQASEYKAADKKFAQVLKASRRHAPTNYYMGVAKTGQAKHKSAARYFKSAVRYDESYYEAYSALAKAYVKSGKVEKAQKVQEDLNERAASCGDCTDSIRIKTAQAAIQTALNGDVQKTSFLMPFEAETAETQYFASVSLINNGQYQQAFNDLKAASAVAGPHPDITTYMGYTQRKLGNYDVAKSYYALALDVDPNHKGANEYLGELYVETGDMEKAKHQLAKLEEICTFGCIEENELRGWIFDALP